MSIVLLEDGAAEIFSNLITPHLHATFEVRPMACTAITGSTRVVVTVTPFPTISLFVTEIIGIESAIKSRKEAEKLTI